MRNDTFIKKSQFDIYNGMVPVFRLIVIFILAIITTMHGSLGGEGWDSNGIGVSVYGAYSLLLLFFGRLKRSIVLKYPLIIPVIDMLLLSYCITRTGGVKSPFYLFYAFSIIFISIMFGLKKSIAASLVSAFFYTAAVLLAEGTLGFEAYVKMVFLIALSFFTGYIYEKISRDTYNMATHDSLTMLHNHQYFYNSLEYMLSKNSKNVNPVSLAIFDIDNFKKVNDECGHLEGDRILMEISQTIKENIRREDIAARYGGDEIVIVLPEVGKSLAVKVCQRIKDKFQSEFKAESGNDITLSIGIATFPRDGTTSLELFRSADQALREAKNSGKNTVKYYCT